MPSVALVFRGRVLPGGLLVMDRPKDYAKYVRSFAGRFVEVVVRKQRIKRSLDQNAYWHAVPFALLADYWGEDIATTKLLILGECFGWKETRDGHRLPMKPSSSALTVEEGCYLTDWMPPWAMTNFGVDIPPPEKAEAA